MVEEKTVLVLDEYEIGAIIRILNDRRTEMLKQQKDPEVVTEILKKVLKAPTKKQRFYKKGKNTNYER
ncbi:MAG: hypothetical protein IJE05_06775 [Clostridia bacterium]|nr:hypothetical protein [Clostridiales bacterium]MBQ2938553.1 hypothetical protein [Clostridia bacterium]